MRRRVLPLLVAAVLALLATPLAAMAGPRSGSSFGGRIGFRSTPSMPRSYSSGRSGYGTRGPNVIVFPGFGWGWGLSPFGMGGGFGMVGTLMMLGVVGLGAVLVVRAMRRGLQSGRRTAVREYEEEALGHHGHDPDLDEEHEVAAAFAGRGYVYKLQLGLGRSARELQGRLERFAAEGDTSTEAGLAELLQQTALDLLRHKDSIRYAVVEANGPMNLTNAETKLNAAALAERSRFQVERVRGADGRVRRAEAAATESPEALEYIVVTLVVATRTPVPRLASAIADREQLETALRDLGGVSPQGLLGMEVVWTPADPADSLTETDLLTTYPEMRGV